MNKKFLFLISFTLLFVLNSNKIFANETVDIVPTFAYEGRYKLPYEAKINTPVKFNVILNYNANTHHSFYIGFYVNENLKEEKMVEMKLTRETVTFEYIPDKIGEDVIKIITDSKNEISESGISFGNTGYTQGPLEDNNIIKKTIKIVGEPSAFRVIDALTNVSYSSVDSSKQVVTFSVKAIKDYDDGISNSVLNIYYLTGDRYKAGENFKKQEYAKSDSGSMTAVNTQYFGNLKTGIDENGKVAILQTNLANTTYYYVITDKFYDEIAQTDSGKIIKSGSFSTLSPYTHLSPYTQIKGSDFEAVKNSFKINYLEGDEYIKTREKFYAAVEFKYFNDLNIDHNNGKVVRHSIINKTSNKTINAELFESGILRSEEKLAIYLTKDEFGNFFKKGANELEGILDQKNTIIEIIENNNSLTQVLTLSNVVEISDNIINVDGTIKSPSIRVEGLGTNTTLNQVEKNKTFDKQILDINNKSKMLNEGKITELLVEIKLLRDQLREQAAELKYLKTFATEIRALNSNMQTAIKTFITYGVDDSTKKLGEGERAAVIHSYKAAFNKLPETEEELADAIKIANGRFPSITNDQAEKEAKEQFIKIYKRIADMNNANDSAAIKVMAYGLRQKAANRNLDSEKAGINSFKGIYGYTPKSTEDWNTMQAITYSGAKRMPDADKDLLSDELEKQLGTNPNKADTDGDGHKDGTEVNGGFDPLKK